jgi:hypothetical protein
MKATGRRLGLWAGLAGAVALALGGQVAIGQSGGGGNLVFTSRRPPRDFVGNIRGWANSNRATSYNEDTQAHTWRVNFMAFLPRAPNAVEVTLAWFHIEANRTRRYVSNEPIALSNPSERIFFHTTSLRRSPGEFDPMERYEAVLSVNNSRGAQELARGQIQLIGQIERREGVVDFTGGAPQVR